MNLYEVWIDSIKDGEGRISSKRLNISILLFFFLAAALYETIKKGDADLYQISFGGTAILSAGIAGTFSENSKKTKDEHNDHTA